MKKANVEKVDMSNVINRLFEGDCLQYMEEIPDGSVDMILCDLPYEESACKLAIKRIFAIRIRYLLIIK